jgi:hypothetical protein
VFVTQLQAAPLLIFKLPANSIERARRGGHKGFRPLDDKNGHGPKPVALQIVKRVAHPFPGCSHHLQTVVHSAGAMDSTVDEKKQQVSSPPFVADEAISEFRELVNTSGHVQELDRNFGFWSICAISIVADDAWAAGGGSLVRSPFHAP